MRTALLALLAALPAAAAPATVRVDVLGLLKAREALVQTGSGTFRVRAEGDAVREGEAAPRELLRYEAHPVTVTVLGLPRTFDGPLELRARGGLLALVHELPLEAYVAAVVGAEAPASAPEAALDALAIVVRSFALERVARAREPSWGRPDPRRAHAAPLCDQTHCQLFKGRESATAAAREAARRTEETVLLATDGRVAPALHHAACGGRTADARDVWPDADPRDREAGAAVDDSLPGGAGPACASRPGDPPLKWTARIAENDLARALSLPAPLDLAVAKGPGGAIQRLQLGGRGLIGPEELHLALGRALGWDAVRSARFSIEVARGDGELRSFLLRGQGHGHGVGLCQRGAAALARKGWGRERILARYFPRLWVGRPRADEAALRARVKP